MPFKKIASFTEDNRCLHPEHRPPTMIVMDPGIYEYKCPACGATQDVVVPQRPTMFIGDPPWSLGPSVTNEPPVSIPWWVVNPPSRWTQ